MHNSNAAMIMTIGAKHTLQGMSLASHRTALQAEAEKPVHRLQDDLIWLRCVLKAMFLINVVIAIASFGFSIHSPAAVALMSTGLLAVLAAIAILAAGYQIEKSKNWIEICIMTLCSVYAPFFVLWVATNNLLSILISNI